MYTLGIVWTTLAAFAVLWVYWNLGQRIALLEHEVRWLRSELEALKPTELPRSPPPRRILP